MKSAITTSIVLALLAAFLFLGGVNCKHNFVDPYAEPDTTSHNFTWQSWRFGGEAGSSYLNDVAIIDENNIWAVGTIYLKDSTGQPDPNIYNAVHWNGSEWEVKRVSVLYRGNIITPPLYGIYAFSANDIWLSSGVPVHGDGTNWAQFHLFDMGVLNQNDGYLTKLWGKSSSDLYYVGTLGTIAHYNGQRWRKVASGTNLDIQDIWGIVDTKTQEKLILCAASDKYQSSEMKIIRILPQNVVGEFDWTPQRKVHSVWFDVPTRIYACGSGFFIYKNGQWQQDETLPTIFKNRVRANHRNDLFLVGDLGLLTHYNGKSSRVYDSLSLPQGNYEGLAVRDDLVVAVGWNGDRAVVLRGVRANQPKHYIF
ncbi:glucosyl transferase [candidate division KSB1 bacterium]|nr:MAG: glucosyl transferase [candidate division KSB1 bacterium]MBC6951830.1 glucosyl transferase [candidate division KSB1 bacterium]MCE7945631.1 glucosyl transferase [Chlorobi bacterium CHB1]MDL1876501.1 glucosyl transferase [Cytophagia bacterium CHB2]